MTAHDLITIPGDKYNEERTIKKVREVLPSFGYHSEEVEEIAKIIYATKVGVEPRSLLEQIAKDSDLDNLGREDFLDRSEALRVEFGLPEGIRWYDQTLRFIQSHRYYTQSAKTLRGPGKQRNKLQLHELIHAALDLSTGKAAELLEVG